MRYLPAWGGFCSYGISHEIIWNQDNLGPSSNPDFWLIVDDQLYLFRRYRIRQVLAKGVALSLFLLVPRLTLLIGGNLPRCACYNVSSSHRNIGARGIFLHSLVRISIVGGLPCLRANPNVPEALLLFLSPVITRLFCFFSSISSLPVIVDARCSPHDCAVTRRKAPVFKSPPAPPPPPRCAACHDPKPLSATPYAKFQLNMASNIAHGDMMWSEWFDGTADPTSTPFNTACFCTESTCEDG